MFQANGSWDFKPQGYWASTTWQGLESSLPFDPCSSQILIFLGACLEGKRTDRGPFSPHHHKTPTTIIHIKIEGFVYTMNHKLNIKIEIFSCCMKKPNAIQHQTKIAFFQWEMHSTTIKFKGFFVPENKHNLQFNLRAFLHQKINTWTNSNSRASFCTRKPTQLESKFRALLCQKTNTTTIQFEGSFGPKTNTTDLKFEGFFLVPENQHNYNQDEGFSFAPGNQHNYNPIWGFFGRRNPNTTRIKIQGFFAPENQYNQNQNPGLFCTRKSILTELKFEVWE